MIHRRDALTLLISVIGATPLASRRSWADFIPPRPPALPGSYRAPSGAHPFVFATAGSMQRLVSSPSPSAAKALATLEQRVRSALKDPSKFPAPVTGCNLDAYLYGLTYENGGAARTAAELASYAYLTSLNQGFGDPAVAEQASSTARTILMGWSTKSLRDASGKMMGVTEFCDASGASPENTRFAVGLQIARGMTFWVHAQDMLLAMNQLDGNDRQTLEGFLGSVSILLRNAANYRARGSNLDCNRYANHVSIQLAGLIAIARLLGDKTGLEDAAFGVHGNVLIPWTTQVTTAIYGAHPSLMKCYANGTPGFAQLPNVQQGELVDRYRAHDGQKLGYPIFSLTHLMMAARVLTDAGYHAFGPIGGRPSPLKDALDYYAAIFAQNLSPDQIRLASNAYRPDFEQYANEIVSGNNGVTIEGKDGLLVPFLLGASAFPNDGAVLSVIEKAEAFAPKYRAFGMVSVLHLSALTQVF